MTSPDQPRPPVDDVTFRPGAVTRLCGKRLKGGICTMVKDHDGPCGQVALR